MSRCCAVAILCLAALSRPVSAGTTTAATGADPARVLDDVPPGQSKFRVFGGADGLRNLVITNIAQDRDGFLWLSTDDGVYRFDGERFTHFTAADGLVSNMFVVVGVGPDGRVWRGAPRRGRAARISADRGGR